MSEPVIDSALLLSAYSRQIGFIDGTLGILIELRRNDVINDEMFLENITSLKYTLTLPTAAGGV